MGGNLGFKIIIFTTQHFLNREELSWLLLKAFEQQKSGLYCLSSDGQGETPLSPGYGFNGIRTHVLRDAVETFH